MSGRQHAQARWLRMKPADAISKGDTATADRLRAVLDELSNGGTAEAGAAR